MGNDTQRGTLIEVSRFLKKASPIPGQVRRPPGVGVGLAAASPDMGVDNFTMPL